jgi:hypothetical protein
MFFNYICIANIVIKMKLHNINYSSNINTNFCKSRTCKSRFIYFVLIFNTLNSLVYAQTDSIFSNFKKYEIQKIDSLTSLNKEKSSLKYLSLLPSLNYDLKNNSVGVGISFSNIATYLQQSKRNKIETQKLKFQLVQALDLNIEKLETEYNSILNLYEIIQLENENFILSKELFNLKKSQYENNKIPLETWLFVQETHQSKKAAVRIKAKNTAAKMKAFELKIKSPCFRQELLKLSSFNNNL